MRKRIPVFFVVFVMLLGLTMGCSGTVDKQEDAHKINSEDVSGDMSDAENDIEEMLEKMVKIKNKKKRKCRNS